MSKRTYTPAEQDEFFGWLGYRLFTTVIRGHLLDHRRPLSAARDYLRVGSVKEGVERDACEFLVDVAGVGRAGGLTLEEVFEKWSEAAWWRPTAPPPECELCIDPLDKPHIDEDGSKRWRACHNVATKKVLDDSGRETNVCEEHFEKVSA